MVFSFQQQKDKHRLAMFPAGDAGKGTSKDLSCVQWIVCNGVVRVWSMKREASLFASPAPLDILLERSSRE